MKFQFSGHEMSWFEMYGYEMSPGQFSSKKRTNYDFFGYVKDWPNSNSAQLFKIDGIFEICQNDFAEYNIAVPKYRTYQKWCAKQPLATKP